MVTVLTKAGSSAGIMTINGSNGKRITMHSTPPTFGFEHVPNFGSVKREGKTELTRMVDPGLRELSFTHMIAANDYRSSIEPTIKNLQKLVRTGGKVRFNGGSPFFTGAVWFQVTGLRIQAEQLSFSNRISRATLSWTLKQAVDVTATVAKKKAAPKRKGPKKTSKAAPKKAVARTHKLKRGDTLWKLAVKYLGKGARWPEIVKANKSKLKNPNRLTVGVTIKIPKK